MGVKLEDLPEDWQRQARQQMGAPEPTKPQDKGTRVKLLGKFRSQWEMQYDQRLQLLKAAGEVAMYWYESITLKLANDMRYTPDFVLLRWPSVEGMHVNTRDEKGVKQPLQLETARALHQVGKAAVRKYGTPQLEFIEVKGRKREDAVIKFRMAAEQFTHLGAFVMVSKEGGSWKEIERIERAVKR